jgi:hypothetical protein
VNKHHILTLQEPSASNPIEQYVKTGIALPEGRFKSCEQIQLLSANGDLISSSRNVMVYWPDKTIKWCLVRFLVTLDANESKKIYVAKKMQPSASVNHINPVSETSNRLIIETNNAGFHLDKHKLGAFTQIISTDQQVSKNAEFSLQSESNDEFKADNIHYQYENYNTETGPLTTEVSITGRLQHPSRNQELLVRINYSFHLKLDTVKCVVSLHNPKAAQHKKGLWDLGDQNSVIFKRFGFNQTLAAQPASHYFRTDLKSKWQNSKYPLTIYQESSGGDHWDSPVHKNRFNRVPFKHKGYQLTLDGNKIQGERASPVFSIKSTKNLYLNIRFKNFWQNFPKSLSINNRRLSADIFPEQFPDNHELQPGEKKTHEFMFSVSNDKEDLACLEHPIEITLNPNWLQDTKALPSFDAANQSSELQSIIDQGINGSNNFFVKRENIDEYGWRNFGDIYADHETLEHKTNELFVSHYNNQYDPLNGFLQQYLLTGHRHWLELADDLASHITDIDIYHTDEDKAEYNKGLFWHTDHYVPAQTASHRTYSKHQPKAVYQDHAGGGGPGGQHCYTTGLAYHYLLTGCDASKQAVFDLTEWVGNFYEGDGTLAHYLLALKNSSNPGMKNVRTGQYPLDRGTGNYLIALLDSHMLSGEQTPLDNVGLIIKNTISPDDDLTERNLDDVENSWFYTIFLQAIIRFLSTKEAAGQIDSSYFYTRDALLHYADWMIENETPYLDKPEILEYPNSTWAAQDLRKSIIFKATAKYSKHKANDYLSKSAYFFDYTHQALKDDETSTYTRLLSLLMQNLTSRPAQQQSHIKTHEDPRPHKQTQKVKDHQDLRMLFKTAKKTSFKAEFNWLQKRLPWRIKLSALGKQ